MIDSYQYNDHSGIGALLDMLSSKVDYALRVGGGFGFSNQERKPLVHATPEQKAKAMEMARTGQYNCTEIHRATGMCQGSVFKMVRRLGIAVPKGRRQKKATHV
jgi:hypothetical protein